MSHAKFSLHSPVIYCRGLEIQSFAKYLTKCLNLLLKISNSQIAVQAVVFLKLIVS